MSALHQVLQYSDRGSPKAVLTVLPLAHRVSPVFGFVPTFETAASRRVWDTLRLFGERLR